MAPDRTQTNIFWAWDAVLESANESAASAASLDYVKFQAVIKSAASAASLRGGRASGRLDHGPFSQFLVALAAKKYQKIVKISGSVSQNGFCPKVKSPKMGLSIIPRQFL